MEFWPSLLQPDSGAKWNEATSRSTSQWKNFWCKWLGVFTTTPYKKISLKKAKKDNKLSPNYYGPYKALQNIGTMA